MAGVRMTEQKWSRRHFSKVELSDTKVEASADTFHSISPTEALDHSTHLISYQRLILSLSELKSPLTKPDEGSSALDSIAVSLSTNILGYGDGNAVYSALLKKVDDKIYPEDDTH